MVEKILNNASLGSLGTLLNAARTRQVLTMILVLGSVYVLATSTWLMLPLDVPLPTQIPAQGPAKASTPASSTIDIAALQKSTWFGQANAVTTATADNLAPTLSAAESEAVESALRVDLIGVVLADDATFSRAIINNQGKQDAFRVGENLPVGRAVKLVKVLGDRIIIDNGGRYEYINLYENSDKLLLANQTSRSASATSPANATRSQDVEEDDFIDLSQDEGVTKLLDDMRQKVMSDPNALYQMVNISPVMEDGEMKGYRLSPGNLKAEFSQLGFENGDVLVSVNGLPLNSPQAIGDVMSSLQSGGVAELELLRRGNVFNISVSLDAPQ